MPWTTPKSWAAGDVLSAADLNTYIRDNLNFLLTGKALAYLNYSPASDYTVTGLTWTDVDATNLKLTMTVNTGRAIVFASFHLKADNTASSSAEADIILDSTTRAGGTDGLVKLTQNANFPVAILGYWSGLSVASHTFKLQFRNFTAGCVTTIPKPQAAAAGMSITMFGLEV